MTRLPRERELLVRYARRLGSDGLALGTAGNLSVRAGPLVAVTPRGIDYELLTPEMICVVDGEGAAVDAPVEASSELPMHLAVYARSEAAAVLHTHSPYATALSTTVEELPPVHYLIALLGEPVRVAPYATPGSAELADRMARALEGRAAVLLGNHGTIAIGESLERAYSRSLLLEWLAALYYRARLLGDPKLLSPEEIDRVAALLEDYGRPPPRT